jgi:hypothetical protein
MDAIPIIRKNANLEIITKILNSVAQKYECRIEYLADENRLTFKGDIDCCRHITEEALGLFQKNKEIDLPLKCQVDRN